MKLYFLFALSVVVLMSCSSSPTMVVDEYYKHDLTISGDGREFKGVGVLKAKAQKIKIKSPGEISLLTITTCFRDFSVEPDKNWLENKRVYEYVYTPADDLELSGSCMMRINSFDRTGKRHGWALVDFETSDSKMTYQLQCNGTDKSVAGVGICQTRAGLYQILHFQKPVIAGTPMARCAKAVTDDDLTFQIETSSGECVYMFKEKGAANYSRLTTVGYDKIPIRQ